MIFKIISFILKILFNIGTILIIGGFALADLSILVEAGCERQRTRFAGGSCHSHETSEK